jgi:hypothetical protein
MLPEAVGVMMLVVEAFDRLHIPYLVGGSMASALHGVTRSTIDADMVAEIVPEQVHELVKMLGSDFYADEGMILDAIHRQSSFNLIHLKTMFKVDVFISKQRPFDLIQFERRAEQVVFNDPEQKAYIATPEDIILAKLEWFRQGGEVSDRQWRDILGVIKVQEDRLDLEYLKKWAIELGVIDLLQRALKES